jgi:hypothetical protein
VEQYVSAPGAAHFHLQQLLEDLAALAGFSRPVRLSGGLVPDLARSGAGGARMIGDAKASEGPEDTASQDRLAAYVRRLVGSPGRKPDHLLVACSTARDAAARADVLTELAGRSGLTVIDRRVHELACSEHVGRIVVTSVTRSAPPLDDVVVVA